MRNNDQRFCWVIAYIDAGQIHKVQEELKKYPEYEEVEAFIPTIKVLKKTFKKEAQFEEIPLLFNYGFFKIPRNVAVYRNFLDKMLKNISCIIAWVKDNAKKVVNPDEEIDPEFNEEDHTMKRESRVFTDYTVPAAVATPDEIAQLVKDSLILTAHSADDIGQIKPGDFITLRGYPWDGVDAQLISVDAKRRKVLVEIDIFNAKKEMEVDFDNVFFSVYHHNSYDDSLSNDNSLDSMAQNNTLDRAFFKLNRNESKS